MKYFKVLPKNDLKVLQDQGLISWVDVTFSGIIQGNQAQCAQVLSVSINSIPEKIKDWVESNQHHSLHKMIKESFQNSSADKAIHLTLKGELEGRLFSINCRATCLNVNKEIVRLFLVPTEPELDQIEVSQHKLLTIGSLASGMIHDLNNVFSGMKIFLTLINLENQDERLIRYLTSMGISLEKAIKFTQTVLHFLKNDESVLQEVMPNSYIDQILTVISQTLNGKIRLEVELCKDIRPIPLAESELGQVFMNIVVNARDAIQDRGTIKILTRYTTDDPQQFQLIIEDDGDGIFPEHLSQVFVPFFTTKQGDKGTGIGLSIVEKLVRKAKGEAQVFSEEGKCTRFVLSFPVCGGNP